MESKLSVAAVVADPKCIEASVNQEVLINRNSILYMVRPREEGLPRYRAVAACRFLCTADGRLSVSLLAPSQSQLLGF